MSQINEDIDALREAGFKDIARQYDDMASALRVIHTWATFGKVMREGFALSPKDTAKLCEKALRRFHANPRP